MSFISEIIGGIVKPAVDIIDQFVTTDAEKAEAKKQLTALLLEAEAQGQKEVTARWVSDNQGSFLTRNIRPLVLVFLTATLFIMSITDGNLGTFIVKAEYKDIYKVLLMMVYTAYFVGRSYEKVKGAGK